MHYSFVIGTALSFCLILDHLADSPVRDAQIASVCALLCGAILLAKVKHHGLPMRKIVHPVIFFCLAQAGQLVPLFTAGTVEPILVSFAWALSFSVTGIVLGIEVSRCTAKKGIK